MNIMGGGRMAKEVIMDIFLDYKDEYLARIFLNSVTPQA